MFIFYLNALKKFISLLKQQGYKHTKSKEEIQKHEYICVLKLLKEILKVFTLTNVFIYK